MWPGGRAVTATAVCWLLVECVQCRPPCSYGENTDAWYLCVTCPILSSPTLQHSQYPFIAQAIIIISWSLCAFVRFCGRPTFRIGCNVGGMCINILAYAYDIVLLAPSWRGLQQLLDIVVQQCEIINMSLNARESVCMVFTRDSIPVYLETYILSPVRLSVCQSGGS